MLENGNKIDETYHAASCCCPSEVHEVLGKNSLLHLAFSK